LPTPPKCSTRAIRALINDLGIITTNTALFHNSNYKFLSMHSWMKTLWEKVLIFGLDIIVPNFGMEYTWECNRFIVQVLFEMGYSCKILQQLNCVCVFLQVLFLSDILTALGCKINPEVLSWCPSGKV
jgi:hypothetical protein